MTPLSVLDLCPVVEGSDAAQAFRHSLDLAQHVERLGYRRFWVAEHHNLVGVASAATSVVIGHIAAGTRTMRVGAGGIMLPNHAPLVIAEQFGTLEALFPGRIDLGIGRAPGSDQMTAAALRRTLAGDIDGFPQDVLELQAYFQPVEPGQRVQAVPGAGLKVPLWILGSSLYGAQLAAALGLPYAFASHFAPAQMMQAIQLYRANFKPSEQLDRPYLMLGLNAVVAESDQEARFQFTSVQQAFANLRRNRPGRLPPPQEGYAERLPAHERAVLDDVLSCSVVGAPATVARGLRAFIDRTGADELIVATQVFEHPKRLRSYELLAEAHAEAGAQTTHG